MCSNMPFLRHHFDRPVLAVKPPVMKSCMMIQDEIYDQIAYIIAQGWSPLVEHVHPSNSMATYWSYWKLPFFGEKDLNVVVSELEACHRAYPDHHVRIVGYDAYTQSQGACFVVFEGR